ncbi:aspartate-semialdehyde dehydrogenase [Rhodoligotrophos ferricapiens]|uniref:aspartate-semialdehyde dehydrogenase n=1 Tax=Rhodoligotrophos ferricapiens TaxID=3069264 RepID=UPI00315DA095
MQARLDEQLQLTTAEILYYMPDHPEILQTFVWQHYDAAPRYPRLTRFLEFWRTSIEATLAEVRVAHQVCAGAIPTRLRRVNYQWQVN